MKNVRILIVDDHDVVRKGLRAVISAHEGWEVCGEAGTGAGAVTLALQEKPDVIIMDIHMPDLNGLDAAQAILAQLPSTQVLILSAHESESLIRRMLASGARGYVLKADICEDLISAVESICKGRLYFTSSVSDFVLNEYKAGVLQSSDTPQRTGLTAREREVLQRLAEGRGNKEIATSLGISVRTVESHRANLMSKLKAHSLSDLVRWAVQNELIRP
jgi:DNA-binding NarL/FixJ family response regulator